jgi:hypothetical protein
LPSGLFINQAKNLRIALLVLYTSSQIFLLCRKFKNPAKNKDFIKPVRLALKFGFFMKKDEKIILFS